MKKPDFNKRFYLLPCTDPEGNVCMYDPATGAILGGYRGCELHYDYTGVQTADIEVIVDSRQNKSKVNSEDYVNKRRAYVCAIQRKT